MGPVDLEVLLVEEVLVALVVPAVEMVKVVMKELVMVVMELLHPLMENL